jgi:hypothetical protein
LIYTTIEHKTTNNMKNEDIISPIRTVQDFRASVAEWNTAMQYSTSMNDVVEVRRATEVCIREEKRWEECRHLFAFEEEGELIGLKDTSK